MNSDREAPPPCYTLQVFATAKELAAQGWRYEMKAAMLVRCCGQRVGRAPSVQVQVLMACAAREPRGVQGSSTRASLPLGIARMPACAAHGHSWPMHLRAVIFHA